MTHFQHYTAIADTCAREALRLTADAILRRAEGKRAAADLLDFFAADEREAERGYRKLAAEHTPTQ